jgi:hypothetical protein
MECLKGHRATDGKHIIGGEFQVASLRELLNLLAENGEFHLTHFSCTFEDDIDLWVVVPARPAACTRRPKPVV